MAEARCAEHPEIAALGACVRCGTFICEPCAKPRDAGLVSCAKCDPLIDRKFSSNPTHAVFWVIGGPLFSAFTIMLSGVEGASAGFFLCALFSYVAGVGIALLLQLTELGRIRRGESKPGNPVFVIAWILVVLAIAAMGCLGSVFFIGA